MSTREARTLAVRAALLAVLLLILLAARPAGAHFLLNVNLRRVHVEALDDGFRVFMRLPMPMVVATPENVRHPDDPSVVAPYTFNRVVNNQLMHYVDVSKVQADPTGLGRLVADGHTLVVGDKKLEGRVEAVRIHDSRGIHSAVPLFNTLEAARAAVSGPVYSSATELLVGDALVDSAIFYPSAGSKDSFTFSSSLAPGLPGAELTENMLSFHRKDGTVSVYRARGTLGTPIVAGASPLTAAATFTYHGVRHILEGSDHVLFVLCLVLGATTVHGLIWRATGFTIGHTATLIAGFFGYAPKFAWFVPAVETSIALSIIYVAAAALFFRMKSGSLLVTTLMGLLHGFGFSFVLSEILKLDSSDLTLSLISFNVGVEIGQLGIILLVWPALRWLDRRSPQLSGHIRTSVACASMAVAALWVGTRSLALLQSI